MSPWKKFLTTFNHRLLPFLVLQVAAGVCIALLIAGCSSFDELTRVSEHEFPRAETCGHCHGDIYQEWVASPHARAFTSTRFRMGTDDYQFGACLGCHAPAAEVTDDTPLVRSAWREEGVTCVSCHLEEGMLSGPLLTTGLATPHPVNVGGGRYGDSKFCGRCHQGTLKEWETSAVQDKQTCQECHMPSVRRKLTQSTDSLSKVIVAFEEEVPQRRHLFSVVTSHLDAPPLTLDVLRTGGALVTISLHNNLPHAVPTGDFGVRTIRVVTSTGTHREQLEPLDEWELAGELGNAVPSGASRTWRTAVPNDHTLLRIQVLRHAPGSTIGDELHDSFHDLR